MANIFIVTTEPFGKPFMTLNMTSHLGVEYPYLLNLRIYVLLTYNLNRAA